MAEPFLGEVRIFSFGQVPSGWHLCDGATLNVQQNQALFAVISNKYGGDGKTTFNLPDLRGRVPLHAPATLGTMSGEETHTLTVAEMPAHNHEATGGNDATTASAAGSVWGTSTNTLGYGVPDGASHMAGTALATAGASNPHSNMQPSLVLSYCIAVSGFFPPHP